MNMLRSAAQLAAPRLVASLTLRPSALFAGDSWKDRDEAAEKVYINRRQRQALKKLLEKVDKEAADNESSSEEFNRRLREIMTRYRLENEAMATEISHLHRDLRE